MKNIIVVQEDEDLFNIFDRAMFDEDGYLEGYEGMEGYNMTDMDIVAEFDSIEEAEDFIENQMDLS